MTSFQTALMNPHAQHLKQMKLRDQGNLQVTQVEKH